MTMDDEQRLIERAQQGNTAAFEAIVNRHAAQVYNLALRMVRNPQEAEDIAQESFVRVWRALPTFRADAQFTTWLYRIVTNLCYNRLPRLKQELHAVDADEQNTLQDTAVSIERTLLNEELLNELNQAINSLPESQRLLITLRHVQGMSYDEIAQVTEMPLGSVKTGIFRARRQLKYLLTHAEVENHG